MKRHSPEEEEVEEEVEEEGAKEYELTLYIEDTAIKEALKDALAVNEEIPKEYVAVKSQELREFIDFLDECETLMKLIEKRRPEEEELNILSEGFTLRHAMALAKKLIGIDGEGEYIDGEPSPYAQELFKKIWQKYVDCKWFLTMLKGKKPSTPKDLKFVKPPEDFLKIEGEKI